MKSFLFYSLSILVSICSCTIATAVREKETFSTGEELLLPASSQSTASKQHAKGFIPPSKAIKNKSQAGTKINRPNKYLSYSTLIELVNNRPLQYAIRLTREYLEAFGKHIAALGINIHQEDEVTIAKELSRLQDSQQDRYWQGKLFHTIEQYLKQQGIDTLKVQSIMGYLSGQKMKKNADERKKRIIVDESKRAEKKQRSKEFYEANKSQIRERTKAKKAFVKDLQSLIQMRQEQEMTHHRPSALQVAQIAESLRGRYPDESIFRSAVKAYLQKNNYTAEEVLLITGARSRENQKSRMARYRARKRIEADGGEASTGTSHMKAASVVGNDISTLEADPWWENAYYD
jgi:hypothetical protein